jgi:hypothetical protein
VVEFSADSEAAGPPYIRFQVVDEENFSGRASDLPQKFFINSGFGFANTDPS